MIAAGLVGDVIVAVRGKLRLARTGEGVFGQLLQTMATRVSMFALNIATGVVTARALGAEGRGLLAGFLTWPQFIAYSMAFGLTASMLFNVKASPSEKGTFLAATLVFSTLLGAAAATVGVILMPHLLPAASPRDLRLAQELMLVAPVILLAATLQTAAEAVGDFVGANALRGLSVCGTCAAVALLAMTGNLSPLSGAICYLFPQIPVAAWLFRRLRRVYRPAFQEIGAVSRRLLVYGLRCYPIELLTTVGVYIGQAMVVVMLEPVAVGYFTVSVGIARLLEISYGTVASVLLPVTAAQDPAQVLEKTLRAARLNLLLMTAVAIPTEVAIPIFLPLIYGADFAGATTVARLMLVEGIVGGTVWVLMQAFSAMGRPEIPTITHVAALVLSLATLPIVVPTYGVLGAAATLLFVSVAKLGVTIAFYHRALEVHVAELVWDRSDLRFLWKLLRT